VWTLYNCGADVLPPAFEFAKDEDLQADRAKRDAKLYAIGWRPKKSYITREYEIPEEDFDIAGPPAAKEQGGAFAQTQDRSGCSCGCGKPAKQKLFSKITTALSMPKAEKLNAKDRRRWMNKSKVTLMLWETLIILRRRGRLCLLHIIKNPRPKG
jgi:hypothetical protein